MQSRQLKAQKGQIVSLQAKLLAIQQRHRHELDEIETWKQHEMQRIRDQVMGPVLAQEERRQKLYESRLKLIAELKDDNAELRDDNETLRLASLVVAKKNRRTMELTERAHANIQELQRFIPRVEADIRKAEANAIQDIEKFYEDKFLDPDREDDPAHVQQFHVFGD